MIATIYMYTMYVKILRYANLALAKYPCLEIITTSTRYATCTLVTFTLCIPLKSGVCARDNC